MDLSKLSRYSFFAFLFLLPLQTVYLLREVFVEGEKWQYGSILVYASDFVLLFSIIALVFSSWRELMLQVTRHKLQVTSLALLVLWSGFSVFWAPDHLLAGYFFVKLLLAAGVFFLARSLDDDDVKIAIRVLIVGAVLQSLLGTWQFLSQSTFASTLLGMSAHEVAQAGTSVLKGEHQRWLRAYGSLPHPNMLGGFLAAVLVLLVGYLESWIPTWKRFAKEMAVFAAVIILLGLVLTFSRSAWLGAVFGLALLVMAAYRNRSAVTLQFLGIIAVSTLVFIGLFYNLITLRFDGAVIEREGSVSERVQSLEDAKVAIGEGNMLLGTGAGNFTAEMMALQSGRPVWTIQPAHNVPVLIFAELGLAGFVLFAIFVFVIPARLDSARLAKAGIQAIRKLWIPGQARDDRNVIFFIALATLIPSLLLDHYLWTSHFGLFFLFLLLGLASRK
jgi:O-antigen ligase